MLIFVNVVSTWPMNVGIPVSAIWGLFPINLDAQSIILDETYTTEIPTNPLLSLVLCVTGYGTQMRRLGLNSRVG